MKTLNCHCGSFEAKINIEKIDKILKCNCSICKRKGAFMSLVKNEDFKITKGEKKLILYKFHSKILFIIRSWTMIFFPFAVLLIDSFF